MILPALRLLLVAAVLAACTSSGDPGVEVSAAPREAAYGDTLIRALPANVSGLIPNITGDKYSHDAVAMVYSGLITHDKDTNIIPDLAESWDLAGDCRELTFRLRKNARWHDGRPFTADDVVFTHRLMTHPKTPSPYKDDFEDVPFNQRGGLGRKPNAMIAASAGTTCSDPGIGCGIRRPRASLDDA